LYFGTMAEWLPRDAKCSREVIRVSRAQLGCELRKKTTSTVVVVDDNASIRRALRRQLLILGFNVLDVSRC
jgi:hypothetical protein